MDKPISELDFIDIFADNLRDVMREAGISQRDLANEIRVTESTISKYLNKQIMPSLKNFMNICYALDCDPTDLYIPYARIF